MGQFSEEYIADLERAVTEAKEYLGVTAVSTTHFSLNPTEISSKAPGYASSLGSSRVFA